MVFPERSKNSVSRKVVLFGNFGYFLSDTNHVFPILELVQKYHD